MNERTGAGPTTSALEDAARAGNYALLAQLFYSPPSRELLAAIAGSETDARLDKSGALAGAWRNLVVAAGAADARALASEYDIVFVGTGKAEITLYASHYLGQARPEPLLVELRRELAALGLARRSVANEPEDHLAALCDVMRHLTLRNDAADTKTAAAAASQQQQKRFFTEYISPWYAEFCIVVTAAASTNFYKHVAAYMRAFFDIEVEAFELI